MTALTQQVSDPLRPTATLRSQPLRGETRTGAAGAQVVVRGRPSDGGVQGGPEGPRRPAIAIPRAVRPQGGWPRAPDKTGVSVGRVGQNENASPGGKTASGEPQDLVKGMPTRAGQRASARKPPEASDRPRVRVPPAPSTTRRTIERPSPEDPDPLRPRSAASSGAPGPPSSTVNTTQPSSTSTSTLEGNPLGRVGEGVVDETVQGLREVHGVSGHPRAHAPVSRWMTRRNSRPLVLGERGIHQSTRSRATAATSQRRFTS